MLKPPIALALIVAAAAAAAAGAQAASSAAGVWSTPQDHGRVEVRDCGAGVCAYIVDGDHLRTDPTVQDKLNKNPALRTRTLKGLPIFEHMTGGPSKWTGRIYNPVDGGLYSGTLVQRSPDVLVLTGCLIRPLCQSQTWRRAD